MSSGMSHHSLIKDEPVTLKYITKILLPSVFSFIYIYFGIIYPFPGGAASVVERNGKITLSYLSNNNV